MLSVSRFLPTLAPVLFSRDVVQTRRCIRRSFVRKQIQLRTRCCVKVLHEACSAIIVLNIAFDVVFDVKTNLELKPQSTLCKLTCSFCGTLIDNLASVEAFALRSNHRAVKLFHHANRARELDSGNSARKLDSDRQQVP